MSNSSFDANNSYLRLSVQGWTERITKILSQCVIARAGKNALIVLFQFQMQNLL
jgi:hypothetical protein